MLSGCLEVSSNGYFFFFLAVFLAVFFAFLAFLAMLPSVIPKVDSMQAAYRRAWISDYTIIAKLIPRASNRVNDRRTVATCERTKPSRDAWTWRALPDQDGKKFSCGGR